MSLDRDGRDAQWLDALRSEPSLAGVLHDAAIALVLDRDGEQVLHASAAARAFKPLHISDDGRLAAPSAKSALRPLATRAFAGATLRFERVRLEPGGLAPMTTFACRRVVLPSGAPGTLLVLLPSAGTRAAAKPAGTQAPLPAQPDVLKGKAASTGVSAQRPVRFLWEADANGRFTSVSPHLAEAVGEGAARILGRTWDELANQVVTDDSDVAGCFARGETWSGRAVRWRTDDGPATIDVDLAGMPVLGPDGARAGFRGFGLIRANARAGRTAASAPSTNGQAPEPDGSDGQGPEPARAPLDENAAADVATQGTLSGADQGEASDIAKPASVNRSVEWRANDNSQPGSQSERVAADAGRALQESVGDAATDGRASAPPPSPAEAVPSPSGRETASPPRAGPPAAHLSQAERLAFREIARALGARIAEDLPDASRAEPYEPSRPAPAPTQAAERPRAALQPPPDARVVLERLPLGVLVHRGDDLVFANRVMLDHLGYGGIEDIRAAGGAERLFREGAAASGKEGGPGRATLVDSAGRSVPGEVRLTAVEWGGKPASLVTARRDPEDLQALERDLRAREARTRELVAILDTATDGVITLDEAGRILSLNRSAEALFGYEEAEVAGELFAVLLAPGSHAAAAAYLDGLRGDGVASLINDGREVVGRVRQGGSIPLFMTLGRVAAEPTRTFCAVLRDVTALEGARAELKAAKDAAETANARKADVLAKVSHEIRTPLSAIIGFAEVMLEERFGAVGNERYKDYLRDIHDSGRRLVALVDDLVDLARIEAGRMELAFAATGLNALVDDAVRQVQPRAARERVVVRTSFAPRLPAVLADERTLRQVVANLVGNAIAFTEAGGQVIVSTALTDGGEVAFRVRDTGVGMGRDEVEAALEPFRTPALAREGGGAGLGLPLTKALVEANRGLFQITSARDEGTLAEVLFPPSRVLAG